MDKPELTPHAQHILRRLNAEIERSGCPMEGNLFYHHLTRPTGDQPDPSRRHKRDNFLLALTDGAEFLETGFNAGHSALLALAAYPNLTYLGVDIAQNAYTKACAAIIEASFPGRARIIFGDSRIELPRLALQGAVFDVTHVDGGHDDLVAELDVLHALQLTKSSGVVVVDDTHHPPIRKIYEEVIAAGFGAAENFNGQWIGEEGLALRVTPRQRSWGWKPSLQEQPLSPAQPLVHPALSQALP